MFKRNRRPTPAGVILRKYYLEPRGLSNAAFARATGLSRKHVSGIVNGTASITPETAIRFALVLRTSAHVWLNLQNAVDLYDAKQKLRTWRPTEVYSAMGTSEAD
jgi:addiction module HigA family antidote